MHSGLIGRSVTALSKYGIDSFATILNKLERLVMEAGLTEEEALEALQVYYERQQEQERWNDSKENDR